MLTDLGSPAEIAAILAAVFTGLLLIWYLMGSPTPLSPANVRKPLRFAKRKYAERQTAADQRYAERAKLAQREEQCAAFSALEASINRLRSMEQGQAKYHEAEWRRQALDCKADAVRYLGLRGVQITKDQPRLGPLPIQSKNGTIIIDWEPSKWRRGKVQLVLYWHPSSPLTHEEFIKFRFAREPREHMRVLSKPLTDADMSAVGWEYPDRWNDEFDEH